MPSTNEFKPNTVWGTSSPEGMAEEVTCPSGQTCLANRLGMTKIIEAGILGDADSLTAFVGRKHIKKVKGANGKADADELNVRSVMSDPDAFKRMVMLCDRALPVVVVAPTVLLHFTDNEDGTTTLIPPDDREPDAVYTDQVGLEDKVFLFNFAVGGTRDLESFRSQRERAVADLADGESIPVQTKRSSGGAKRKGR